MDDKGSLRHRAVELGEDIVGNAEECREGHVERGISHGLDADAAEEEDRRIGHPVGDAEQPHLDADERQVEDDEHQIADPHRGDQAPEEIGIAGNYVGPGLNIVGRICSALLPATEIPLYRAFCK
ncbi:hypothetical protein LMTR3_09820 [Bradyrhizobium sp. LMTR 3]|nr:hypothetical protein LMTR3_09820 [Bradyrhizobium sp. LMTR 3]